MVILQRKGLNKSSLVNCPSSTSVGDLVYITSAATNRYEVDTVDVTDYNKVPAVAVITKKISASLALAQFLGEVKGVFLGLSPGKTYFIGLDGKPSLSPPVAPPPSKTYVQSIGVALDSDTLYINPDTSLTRIG